MHTQIVIIKYCKKYDIKYVPSVNPIIFIPSLARDSFSATILYIYKHNGHIYAITKKKGIINPINSPNLSSL